MKVNLDGRVALVTGAARGIGQAIADTLAENGATVIYSDRDIEGVKAAAARAPRGEGHAMVLDVTDETGVEQTVQKIVAAHGGLDILVNNAGVNTMEHRVPIDQFPKAEWDRLLSVDLTGVYIVSKAACAPMLKSGYGRIVNIASVVGLVPLRLQCAFAAAKAGVVNLTKAMALELGPRGVLVNCIAPGSILTDGTRQLFYGDDGKFKDSVQKLLDHIPLGRPGEPQEIADATLFFSSRESSYINGAILTVDGGWTCGFARDF